jgi:hypothetical protein
VQQYLATLPPVQPALDEVAKKVGTLQKPVITKEDVRRLEGIEAAEAQKRGAEEFKFASNEEMLQALGVAEVTADSTD